jgi:hypothetical protein
MLRSPVTSTSADKTMFVARSGRTHLRSFASRRKARRTHRPKSRPKKGGLAALGQASRTPSLQTTRAWAMTLAGSSGFRHNRWGGNCELRWRIARFRIGEAIVDVNTRLTARRHSPFSVWDLNRLAQNCRLLRPLADDNFQVKSLSEPLKFPQAQFGAAPQARLGLARRFRCR